MDAEKLKTRPIAFGAMYSAFSVLLLILSVSFGDDMFFLMLSSLPLAFVMDQFGLKTAFTSYFTILFLAFAFFGLRPSVIGFAILFGPYTLIRQFVPGRKFLQIGIRWLILVALSIVFYLLLKFVMRIEENYFEIATLALSVVALLLYERMVEYAVLWHKRFIRKFSNMGR